MNKKRATGFTIVELLVVIVVIGILATISIVVYSGIRERAVSAGNAVAIRQYVQALEMYSQEHGGYPNGSSCLGQKPANANGCGGLYYEGRDACIAIGIPAESIGGEPALGSEWKPFLNEALTPYMGSQPQKVQVMEYDTVLASVDGCSLRIRGNAPMYQSGTVVTLKSDGDVWLTYSGNAASNGAAYAISYAVPGDAATCPLPNSSKSPTSSVCVVYGGKLVDER